MAAPDQAKTPFELRAESVGGATVLSVLGEVDLATHERLAEELTTIAASGEPIVIDLSGCDFIDSSGIRALLLGKRASEKHGDGRLLLAGAGEQVTRILEVTGIGEAMPMHTGVDEALASLGPAGE